MTDIQKRLFELQDMAYRDFHSGLIPELPKEHFIGIRVPVLKKFAKEYKKEAEAEVFLKQLPHTYYEEYMLHGLLIAEIKDYAACIQAVEAFLPYIDNWAVSALSGHFYVCKLLQCHGCTLLLHSNVLSRSLNIPSAPA